jgi:hypothetical protein
VSGPESAVKWVFIIEIWYNPANQPATLSGVRDHLEARRGGLALDMDLDLVDLGEGRALPA